MRPPIFNLMTIALLLRVLNVFLILLSSLLSIFASSSTKTPSRLSRENSPSKFRWSRIFTAVQVNAPYQVQNAKSTSYPCLYHHDICPHLPEPVPYPFNFTDRSYFRDYGIISRRSSDPFACGFIGNADIYGLGVRLGLYIRWLTALITRLSSPSPDSVRDLLDTDAVFLLALFIAKILLVIGSAGPVHSMEMLILVHLFFGDVFVILWNVTYLDYKRPPLSVWGLNCRTMIIVGMSAFATWFRFKGEEQLPQIRAATSHSCLLD